jgi:hypothetical protein
MIAEVIKLVQLDEFYRVNKLVEISKGYYEIPTGKNLLKKIKRQIKWQI